MKLLLKFDSYLKKFSTGKLILLFWLLTYVATLPITVLQLNMNERPLWKLLGIGDVSIGTLIVIGVFVAPFIETFMYQTVVFGVLNKISFFSKKEGLIVIISGTIFGLTHNYSFLYVLHALILGVILAYSYNLFRNRKEGSYLMVSAIHSLRNIVAVIFFIIGIEI